MRGVRLQEEASRMREEFDRLFTAPDPPPPAEMEDFVAIRVGGQPFALRVAELARIEPCRKVVPLPGGPPHLLGLTNLRGRLVPIYDLESALGLPSTAGARRWAAVCGDQAPLGFTFDELDGYLRVPRSSLLGSEQPSDLSYEHQGLREAGGVRPVVRLTSLLTHLSRT